MYCLKTVNLISHIICPTPYSPSDGVSVILELLRFLLVVDFKRLKRAAGPHMRTWNMLAYMGYVSVSDTSWQETL